MKRYTVECGIDRLDLMRDKLAGKRVGILTSASGVDKSGVPSYIRLAEYAKLSVIFAPEHGLFTNAQDGKYGVETIEPYTGAHICNLCAKDYREAEEYLRQIDLLCYDIQDVGARFYTYIWSLFDLMRICGRIGLPVLVLDRPNMVGGNLVEGAILDPQYASFIGRCAIPTRYGMTAGELITYLNDREKLGCTVEVLSMEGWTRTMAYDETDLLFVSPSPNIPSVETAYHYLGNCIWESTNLSEGRGTTSPFRQIGAPFVSSAELFDYMTSFSFDGVIFRRTAFIPQFQKHAGKVCEGIAFHLTDREAYEPTRVMLYLWKYFEQVPEFSWDSAGAARRFGREMPEAGDDIEKLLTEIRTHCRAFQKETAQYLLY